MSINCPDHNRNMCLTCPKKYYMGRTAEEFAASEVPNGIQRKARCIIISAFSYSKH